MSVHRRLIVLRHADAVRLHDARPGDDERRWLTARGREQARHVGALLVAAGEMPALIVASPLVRAVQTAELVAAGAGYAGEVVAAASLSPEGSLSTLLASLEPLLERGAALVVGHQPLVGAWADRLTGRRLSRAFEPSFGVAIDFDAALEPGAGTVRYCLSGDHPTIETA